MFNDARNGIDKVIILLYHFTYYLYHISNGSPKKMRLNFENFIRPIKDSDEFHLSKGKVERPFVCKAHLIPESEFILLEFPELE